MIVKYYFKVMGDGEVHEFHSDGKTPAEAEFDLYLNFYDKPVEILEYIPDAPIEQKKESLQLSLF